jgi:hypothetical protein
MTTDCLPHQARINEAALLMAAEMGAEIASLVSEGRGFTPSDQAIAKARTERIIGRYMEDKRTMCADGP